MPLRHYHLRSLHDVHVGCDAVSWGDYTIAILTDRALVRLLPTIWVHQVWAWLSNCTLQLLATFYIFFKLVRLGSGRVDLLGEGRRDSFTLRLAVHCTGQARSLNYLVLVRYAIVVPQSVFLLQKLLDWWLAHWDLRNAVHQVLHRRLHRSKWGL